MITEDDFNKIQSFKSCLLPLFRNGTLSSDDWNTPLSEIIDKVMLKEKQEVDIFSHSNKPKAVSIPSNSHTTLSKPQYKLNVYLYHKIQDKSSYDKIYLSFRKALDKDAAFSSISIHNEGSIENFSLDHIENGVIFYIQSKSSDTKLEQKECSFMESIWLKDIPVYVFTIPSSSSYSVDMKTIYKHIKSEEVVKTRSGLITADDITKILTHTITTKLNVSSS